MSKSYEVPVEPRADVGKGTSRRLRRAGLVPAVVYGGEQEPVALTVRHDFIQHAAAEEAFHSSILELRLADGRRQSVILRDLQRHPFKPVVLHADFQRVSADHEIRMSVPLHFVHEELSPAGRQAGVVISHQITEVEISSLPSDLPEYIEVDLAGLDAGDSIMLRQVQLPKGVTIPALEHDEELDVTVVSAIWVRESQGTGALAAEADAALAAAEEQALDERTDEIGADAQSDEDDHDGKADLGDGTAKD